MKKKYTYVKCTGCKWQLDNYPNRDWEANPCPWCNNTRQVMEPREILCNLCGGTMCPIGTHNEQITHGLYKASVMGGYDSYHLWDCTRYTFSFCEKCLRHLFMSCTIKPTIEDIHLGTGDVTQIDTWEKDFSSYEYRLWCDAGGKHQAYLKKLCNATKNCPNKAIYTIYCNERFTEDTACKEHKKRFEKSISYKLVPFIAQVFKPYL